ncbi:MAG: hypothetical protein IKP01_02205 [Bacteroidales bacterium]|nr:hypothetical protein [Bacteroidales bacterium]
MAERVTVGGVEAPCDASKLADIRFVLMLGDLDDGTLPDSEKLATMARLTRYLFGAERDSVVDALAEANGGALPAEEFSRWLADYLSEVGAKN